MSPSPLVSPSADSLPPQQPSQSTSALTPPRPSHAGLPKNSRPKSPPLAFERTPNDALLASSSHSTHAPTFSDIVDASPSIMGRLSPSGNNQLDLQVIVDQQANAIQLLHEAFAAERQVWSLEKERMYQRIASLENLLKTRDHQRLAPYDSAATTHTHTHSPAVDPILGLTRGSPAKSPQISPGIHSGPLSPQSRSHATGYVLPTIAETEFTTSLSSRREGAPRSIDLPSRSHVSENRRSSSNRRTSVSFVQGNNQDTIVEEIPLPARAVSPPPLAHRILAGHTPVRLIRPPTPPPPKMTLTGIEDTPTRNNTHINALLTQGTDEEADRELNGPLNMPELPHKPDDTNFTFDMLARKLERLGQHPEAARPQIFSQPTPGVASPSNEREDYVDGESSNSYPIPSTDTPFAPIPTVHPPDSATAVLSPSAIPAPSSRPSPANGIPTAMSPEETHEAVKHDFEQGGIRLKKKPSVNFGAPLGTLAGFGKIH